MPLPAMVNQPTITPSSTTTTPITISTLWRLQACSFGRHRSDHLRQLTSLPRDRRLPGLVGDESRAGDRLSIVAAERLGVLGIGFVGTGDDGCGRGDPA